MDPEIKTLLPLKLVGIRQTISFAQNTTPQLWGTFMPRRKEIVNTMVNAYYSVQLYPEGFFDPFNPDVPFEKWAAAAVTGFDAVPEGMETLTLPGGLYAVFVYKGNPAQGAPFFRSIFTEWLPQKGYRPDNRPHFEVMGEKYKNGSDDSEEEVWIPIKP